MREILFRGKRVDNGEWVEGYYFRAQRGGYDWEAFILKRHDFIDGIPFYEVIPETVSEYTGLTDKNGKKIFEGDILQYRSKTGRVIGNAWGTDTVYGYAIDNPNLDLGDYSNMEVIGNIHDNPELLKCAETDAW